MRTVVTKKGETALIRGRKFWCSCWLLSAALTLALLDHLLSLPDKETSLGSESGGRRHVRKLKVRRRLGRFVLDWSGSERVRSGGGGCGEAEARAAASSDDDCGIG
jgi:hypothetical protein